MIERAEWRVRADDPKTPIGWMVGVDRWQGVPVYWVVAGTCLIAILLRALFEAWFPFWWGDLASLVLPFGGLFLFMLVVQPRRRIVDAPNPAPTETFDCLAELSVDSGRIGSDRGNVALSDGWLVYEGRRTSFSLSPTDVASLSARKSPLKLHLQDGTVLRFSREKGLQEAVEGWLAGPSPVGLSRLPPNERHPETRHAATSWLAFISAVLLGGGLGVALTLFSGTRSPFVVAIVLGCLAASAVLALLSRRRT